MFKSWATPILKVTDEERKMIDDAIAAGNVTRVKPGAAQNDEMTRATKELAAEKRKEFVREQKKDKSK